MREIRFRAWEKDEEVMIRSESFGNGFDIFLSNETGKMELIYLDDCSRCNAEFMQYTGLHDKNGVKIYEGDIVKVADRLCKICWFEPQATFDMEFIKYIENPLSEWGGCSNNQWQFLCEVVGNIYENPELLKKVE